MSQNITIGNITCYPAFAKKSKKEQIAFFKKQKSIKTDAQAEKIHAQYLKEYQKLNPDAKDNTRGAKK